VSLGRVKSTAALALGTGALVAGSAMSAGAHPPAPVGRGGKPIHGKYHRWLHRAKVPLVRGRVQILVVACPGGPRFAGCVYTRRPRRIYLSPRARRPRFVLYHELGHLFDLKVLNQRERRRFKRILHLGRRAWFGRYPPPGERFADGYAACGLYGRRRPPGGRLFTYRVSRRQHRAVCRLIVRAAAPRGRRPQRPRRPPPVIETEPPPPSSGQPPHDSGPGGIYDLLPVVPRPLF
jgi:hypothetical protein